LLICVQYIRCICGLSVLHDMYKLQNYKLDVIALRIARKLYYTRLDIDTIYPICLYQLILNTSPIIYMPDFLGNIILSLFDLTIILYRKKYELSFELY
jgi:hypothetical protein